MKDEEIREFFLQNRPQTSDEGTFLAGLSAKMEAMEEVKSFHDASIRRYRKITVAALVAGIIAGGCISTVLLLNPSAGPGTTTLAAAASAVASWKSALLGFIIKWKSQILGAIPLAAVILSLIPWRRRGVSPLR